MAATLISMLRTTSGSSASKAVSTSEDNIEGVDTDNIIGSSTVDNEANVIGNKRSSALRTSFLILEARLNFAKLK